MTRRLRPSASRLGLGDPARYTAAECFHLREREKYLDECRKKYPNDDDAGLLKRYLKWARQQGHNLLKDSESLCEEVRAHVGPEPYSRERFKNYKDVPAFFVGGVVVGGEQTDALIPADFLTNPELRQWVERLTGDPALVQRWSDQAARFGNVWLRFLRASKGAADQGRPRGKPKVQRPHVIAFRKEFYRRLVAAEKKHGQHKGHEKEILDDMAKEEGVQVEALQKRLCR